MNRRARAARAARHALRQPDRPRRARQLLVRRATSSKLALVLRRNAFFRATTEPGRAPRCTRGSRDARISSTATTSCAPCPFVNGVKTGHTNEAGYVLVGSAHARRRHGRQRRPRRPERGRARRRLAARCCATACRATTASPPVREGAVLGSGGAEVPRRPGRPRRRAHGRCASRGAASALTTCASSARPTEIEGPLAAGARVGTVVVRQRGKVVARVAARHRARRRRRATLGQRLRRLPRPRVDAAVLVVPRAL